MADSPSPFDSSHDDSLAAPSPEALAQWDASLQTLWNSRREIALLTARELFRRQEDETAARAEIEERLSEEFLDRLYRQQPADPETAAARYEAVVVAVRQVLRAVRLTPSAPFIEEYMAVAFRPVRRLHSGALTPEVCAVLYDYNRGVWTPHLTKPQDWIIHTELAKTLAALPPDSMDIFWEEMRSEDGMVRSAMLLGLGFLRSAHAVPTLLHGLQATRDHATRAAIVDCLEAIADPTSIVALSQLKRESARYDWTLARHIGRVIRVIELQNRGQSHRTLLRPASSTPVEDHALLRPAANTADAQAEHDSLLRPAENQEDA